MTIAESLEVEIIDRGGALRDIAFEIPAQVVKETLDEACDQLARSVRLPGFRSGKIPRQVIRGRFADQIKQGVLERLVPEYYQQALTQSAIEPLAEPVFAPFDLQDGPLKVVATVEVQPEMNLAPYDGLEITGTELKVTDEDLAVAHKSLQESMAALEPVEEGYKAAPGDHIEIDFEGRVDGTPFEGGKAEGYALTLGEAQLIPGFEEQLEGHTAGETFDINVTFPDDYSSDDLKGKDAVFSITLHRIQKKVLPEIDDAFASQVGDFADMDALNEVLKEQILSRRTEDQRRIQRRQVLAKLLDTNEFEPPEGLVEEELNQLLVTAQRLILMQGKTLEEAGFDLEKAREEHLSEAKDQARIRLLVREVAKAEGITVSDEDVGAEIGRLAEHYQRPLDEVDRAVRGDVAELARMRQTLLQNKVLDVLVDRANVTVVPRTEAGDA